MGLMDRDYYREKRNGSEESLFEKLKRNPLGIVALIIALLFIISLLI